MDDIVRRAMLGDQVAAERLTGKGVLLPCPFCQSKAEVHICESQSKYVKSKKEIPKDARLIICNIYPSGEKNYEYRSKVYVPRCVNRSCIGRAGKQYKTMRDAIKKWNTRPAILTQEQIDGLEG